MADTQGGTVFDGVPADALAVALARLERRRYPAGATLITEGDEHPDEMYVVESGLADVFVADRNARAHRVGRVGPGAALGEMALFTGQRAAATVRAASNLDVTVIPRAELHCLAADYPAIYRNLGVILAERLTLSNHRLANAGAGRIALLDDRGSPPLLGYALACSLAWHSRRRVLLLLVAERAPDELAAFASPADPIELARRHWDAASGGESASTGRAEAAVVAPDGGVLPTAFSELLHELGEVYDFVLVQGAGLPRMPAFAERNVRLIDGHAPADAGESRAGHTLRGWQAEAVLPRPGRDGVLDVPPLSAADEAALATGLLPAASAAGAALGWLARDLAGLKVGLALGGGAIKGFAHLGVLRVLERYRVPVDYIAGTSIGSAVAALYAAGLSLEEAQRNVEDVGSQAFRPTLSTGALLSSNGLRAGLRRVAGEARIEDMRIPLAVVAADILQRREVVFRRGPVWLAVLASMSIPGIYSPLRLRGLTLVDGGVLNPVPASVVAAMGADVVIGVKLANRPSPLGGEMAETLTVAARSPSVLQAITRTIELMQSKIGADTAATATILIEPAFAPDQGWGLRNFRQGRQLVPLGETAAEAAMPRIAAALPWLRKR